MGSVAALADGAPPWARDLASAYLQGAASVFLLHGNVHDLVPSLRAGEFVSLEHYFATELFGTRDVVLSYDRGSGLRFLAPDNPRRRASMREDFERTLAAIDVVGGTSFARSLPRDPGLVLELLDRYILHKLVETPKEGARKSLAILLRYVETISPAVESASLSGELGANLIRLLNWANDPGIRGGDVTLCLLTESLSDVHARLVENPFISKIEIPLPDEATRACYARVVLKTDAPEAVARESNGLTLAGLTGAVGGAGSRGGAADSSPLAKLREAKKNAIEKSCLGLVEFVAPRFDLGMLVAPAPVKERLEQDVSLFKRGRLEALPMGYLLCGVIGTGKTFTATCFAGSLGIPAVVFRNLRSKWVGSSEGNLQKVLSVVKALGPVVVVIDEADAALGSRATAGDSGTSSRMFAMISSLMSDTSYRGRILWMLLTCRPDLLPVDLKRQGRCEVHIPLFPPETEEARREMFLVLARKAKLPVAPEDVPPIPAGLTGADIESLVVQAIRRAALEGDEAAPGRAILEETLSRLRVPDYGLEKELQELVAIREATDPRFIPDPILRRYGAPDKAEALDRRIHAIAALLGSSL
jgi:hypothetical protein